MDSITNQDSVEEDVKFLQEYYDSKERKDYSVQRINNDVGDITEAIIAGRKIIESKTFIVG
ncbi:MAG: hypothetical protein V3U92_10880 [Cellulophaga sp.]